MCVTATAKRRRRQARNGYKHLAVHGKTPRRLYRKHTAEFYTAQRMSAEQKLRQIALNKAKRNK